MTAPNQEMHDLFDQGKPFVNSLSLATIRSEQKIALALASSGIAATLLEGSRTAHSALK